jgi:cell division protein FtsN
LTSSQIQVFSSRSKTQAEAVLARLSGAGLRPELQKADLKEKGVWYRIRLNGYPSRQAAAAAGNKLRAEALIEDYWVVR